MLYLIVNLKSQSLFAANCFWFNSALVQPCSSQKGFRLQFSTFITILSLTTIFIFHCFVSHTQEVGKWKESLANHADDYFRHQNKHFPVFLMGNKVKENKTLLILKDKNVFRLKFKLLDLFHVTPFSRDA